MASLVYWNDGWDYALCGNSATSELVRVESALSAVDKYKYIEIHVKDGFKIKSARFNSTGTNAKYVISDDLKSVAFTDPYNRSTYVATELEKIAYPDSIVAVPDNVVVKVGDSDYVIGEDVPDNVNVIISALDGYQLVGNFEFKSEGYSKLIEVSNGVIVYNSGIGAGRELEVIGNVVDVEKFDHQLTIKGVDPAPTSIEIYVNGNLVTENMGVNKGDKIKIKAVKGFTLGITYEQSSKIVNGVLTPLIQAKNDLGYSEIVGSFPKIIKNGAVVDPTFKYSEPYLIEEFDEIIVDGDYEIEVSGNTVSRYRKHSYLRGSIVNEYVRVYNQRTGEDITQGGWVYTGDLILFKMVGNKGKFKLLKDDPNPINNKYDIKVVYNYSANGWYNQPILTSSQKMPPPYDDYFKLETDALFWVVGDGKWDDLKRPDDTVTTTYTIPIDFDVTEWEKHGFNNLYSLTEIEVRELINVPFERYVPTETGGEAVDLSQYVNGLKVIPYKIPDDLLGEKVPISIGKYTVPKMSCTQIGTEIFNVEYGNIKALGKDKNSLDYTNKRAVLHLPYTESVNIEMEYVVDSTLKVDYLVNFTTGNATVNIYSSKLDGVLYSKSINIATDLKLPNTSQRFNTDKLMGFDSGERLENRWEKPTLEIMSYKPHLIDGLFTIPIVDEGLLGGNDGYVEVDNVELKISGTLREREKLTSILKNGVIFND